MPLEKPAQTANIHAKGREKLMAHAAMLLFAALVAGSFSFGGLASRALGAAPVTLLRYLMTVVVMGVVAFGFFRAPRVFPRQPWRFAVLGGLIAIYMLTMFTALEITSPVATGAVFTLMPLLSAALAFLLMGQKTRGGVIVSLVIAAMGAVWVIFRGNIDAILAFDVGRGELIYLVGVTAHAAYVPLIRKFERGEHPVAFGFWVVVFTVPWLLPFGLRPVLAIDYGAVPATIWLILAYLAVVTTAITFMLLQFASMRLPASKMLGYNYLTPSFIILLEGLLGHGWTTMTVVMGAVVTALGLLVVALLPD
ncbi:DMT family transporter [Rhizobium sp. SG2393]|uniref:DMT family transporter n=1 Tax=Rhizobium sp. SG2393 TaxID=3276279 RepID=UPI00366BAA66